ncbi:hypothetical protein [Natrarchaeobaculum sulfurireducens]|uniref:Uncharacterized protein n=1 Tax=Natrarchaeobaculum sulfurireducens TaxID=2044521 RepID=A0A346PQF6_9EURY|nr:hypothetical protein [Natrarchaeobaculum sulfurireducens]AXR81751.1 hypothetical protein AArcMg_1742 [Natrarchaeobaculum sulfurireducens]
MSDDTDETGKESHGRNVELTKERSQDDKGDEDDEDDELTEEEKAARERQDEEQRRQDIEHRSTERENDALENVNPNNHRDEEPYKS